MWSEFAGILAAFEPAHPEARALKVALGKCKDSRDVSEVLTKTTPDRRGHWDSQEFWAFHLLCKACLCDEDNSLQWAAEDAAKAIKTFRKCGNSFHEGLARRVLAVLYRKQGLESLAISEIGSVMRIYQICADTHSIENEYDKKNACEAQLGQCKQQLQEIEAALLQAESWPDASPKKPSKVRRRPAQIVYGVFDMVHAGIKGVFVMDDSEISEMAIEEILFDGKKHRVFNLREGRQIKVVPSGRYAWLRVAGNSMNAAKPVPVEPNDYVLVDFNLQPQNGNLVFAALNDAPTPKERAGVIKRLASDGLYSESSENYGPIPLTKAKLQGVVLAVAKPEDEPVSSVKE
jgi:hypothetical protein